MELFQRPDRNRPLAWRMMPRSLDEFVGQEDLLGPGKPLRRLIEEDRIVSLILFGPPGTGKTAIARIIANKTRARFISLNAVTSGVKDIKDALLYTASEKTILFIDEIHRFNRLQQDALLPHVESGEITLIGASTQNPFFALVPALSSRSIIFEFKPLNDDDIKTLLKRALESRSGLGEYDIRIDEEVLDYITLQCSGDGRKALNILEIAFLASRTSSPERVNITIEKMNETLQKKSLYYDQEEHYDIISAFIKSMRGSDPDATVYWLARMLESGEDPMFIARRIVICASEDVGNADPRAIQVAVSAMNALEKIGMPEGRIPLAQAAIYVATAPKSNSSYLAIEKATEAVLNEPLQQVPLHLKDAHYPGSERLGRGNGYLYPHNFENHYIDQRYLEEDRTFYSPTEEGYERTIRLKMNRRRINRK
jgi:putative ATPase